MVEYMSIETEKNILKQYGKIIEYSELKEKHVENKFKEGFRTKPMYFVKKSQLKRFSTTVIDEYSPIKVPNSTKKEWQTSEVNLLQKKEDYLEVELCVEEFHFIPDKILKDDILFFFLIEKNNMFFLIVEDGYINQFLNSEHSIFGMIDFCEGSKLLFERDNSIKSKFEKFQVKMKDLAQEYKEILFVTISDSIIIKFSFKIIDHSNDGIIKLKIEDFDFNQMIDIFKKIRSFTKEIFNMNIYGVFSYGMNKCKTSMSNSTNLFHTGILSNEFKLLIEKEKECRAFEEKGDMYVTDILRRAFHHHFRKKQSISRSPMLCSISKEWQGPKDITVLEIPDEPFYL